jgi:competence protein ComEC
VVRLTLAYGAGVAVGLHSAPWASALPLVALAVAVPILLWWRSGASAALVVAALMGVSAGAAAGTDRPRCEHGVSGSVAVVRGRFLASPAAGSGSAPLERDGRCGALTVVLPAGEARHVVVAGTPVQVRGEWRDGRRGGWLRADSVAAIAPTGAKAERVGPVEALRWAGVRRRDRLVRRIDVVFGARGPLVAALVLARREGLDRELRETFAVAGAAHLLAISGFHVGVIAALLFTILRSVHVGRVHAAALCAAGVWGYVAFIGFPDAACRAALILSLEAAARLRGGPPSRWAPLASAALILLVADPRRLASAGFQLSFAGAAALLAWAGPIGRRARQALQRQRRFRPPREVVAAAAAGVAATLGTLPLVAWHFGQVSLIGIPVTLAATPLVALALPGAIAVLALDAVSQPMAAFLAGGIDVLLAALLKLVSVAVTLPLASVWIGRGALVAGAIGCALALHAARAPGVGGSVRRRLMGMYLVAAVVAWPGVATLANRGRLEILLIDVGQGDAIAIRTPRGRWMLIDAGPPAVGDPQGHPVVRTLRDRGVGRLDLLLLTHPDLDHIGGAAAVLDAFMVHKVLDPLLPAPKEAYADLVDRARAEGVAWQRARAGDGWEADGVRFAVLHPDTLPTDAGEGNAASIVVHVTWGEFDALFTGDADAGVERQIAGGVGDLDLLKVGHHGSATSTDPIFLATVRPEVAVISVGGSNRYGHPAPQIVERLQAAGAEIRRTDREGTIRVSAQRDGRFTVRGERRRR